MRRGERAPFKGVDRAVVDTLLPSGADGRLTIGALESGFENFLEDFRTQGAPELRRGFRIALFAAGWIAPFFVWRLPPLSRLGTNDRERALEAMERSRFALPRQLMTVLKTVVALHYGASPAVREAIGYHP